MYPILERAFHILQENGLQTPIIQQTSLLITISEDSRKEYHKVWLKNPFHQGKF
jgi:hypothetical protein